MKNYILVVKRENRDPQIVTKYRESAPIQWPGLWGTGITIELPDEVDPECVELALASEDIEAIAEVQAGFVVVENLQLKAERAAKLAQEAQSKTNADARAFLAATDWMVIRALEKGEEISQELKDERQAARNSVID
jgi:hypothetical protein